MSTSSSLPVVPKRHRWDIHLKSGEDDRMWALLVQPLARGLSEAGVTFTHQRGGRPHLVHGLYPIQMAGKPWAFRLFPYCHLRWLWRITLGIPSRDGFGLLEGKEFTLLDEELTEQTGRDFGALIRALSAGQSPVWPMFDHDPSFPRYAWSNAATDRYDEWRRWHEATVQRDSPRTSSAASGPLKLPCPIG